MTLSVSLTGPMVGSPSWEQRNICTRSPGLVYASTFGAWQVSVSMVIGWRLRSLQAGLLQQKGRVQFSHR